MPHILKSLELNGFKSFANRTRIDFSPGITGIVGPNGSGKSNVVDAIRWLLGERDAKSLRGATVEDLIFSGTPKRARVGQAQAALLFDNREHFFPVDYTEIAVARQVNRDGESTYAINGSPVLLRDLVDFLARARLGARGAVVVTQGNSDAFVQAKPQERRAMVEEILGLKEYQLKKQDAARRLSGAEQNMLQVRSLLEEIVPHLRSLKRQTSRWEKRDELEQELRSLEQTIFTSQLAHVAAQEETLAARVRAHEKEYQPYRERYEAARKAFSTIEAQQLGQSADTDTRKRERETLLVQRLALQKELGRLEAQLELSHKSATVRNLPDEEEVRDVLEHIQTELDRALEGDIEQLPSVIGMVLKEIKGLLTQTASSHTSEELVYLQEKLEQLGSQVKIIEEQLHDIGQQEETERETQASFYDSLKRALSAVEATQQELERFNRATREFELERERLQLHREDIYRHIEQAGRSTHDFTISAASTPSPVTDDMHRRMLKLRTDVATIGEVDQTVVTEAKETQERYDFLERQLVDLEKAQTDFQQLIENLRKKIDHEFTSSLSSINNELNNLIGLMFGGGSAKLVVEAARAKTNGEGQEVTDVSEEKEIEPGIQIQFQLPGKKVGSLDVLSGGERSLLGVAAVFALISVSPPPFLVLDEIDAPLDEKNARRFCQMLKNFAHKTQFVVVTHNRATMEAADILYGVTLEPDGTSKVLSLKLEA